MPSVGVNFTGSIAFTRRSGGSDPLEGSKLDFLFYPDHVEYSQAQPLSALSGLSCYDYLYWLHATLKNPFPPSSTICCVTF